MQRAEVLQVRCKGHGGGRGDQRCHQAHRGEGEEEEAGEMAVAEQREEVGETGGGRGGERGGG